MVDLDAIRARLAAATPGPWRSQWGDDVAGVEGACVPDEDVIVRPTEFCEDCFATGTTLPSGVHVEGGLQGSLIREDGTHVTAGDLEGQPPCPKCEGKGFTRAEETVVGLVWWNGYHVACTQENADLIAHAPADLAALCAEVEVLRAQIALDNAVVHRPSNTEIVPK